MLMSLLSLSSLVLLVPQEEGVIGQLLRQRVVERAVEAQHPREHRLTGHPVPLAHPIELVHGAYGSCSAHPANAIALALPFWMRLMQARPPATATVLVTARSSAENGRQLGRPRT